MNTLIEHKYEALLEDFKAFKTEAEFDLRFRTVEWAHKGGEIIRQYQNKDITKLLPKLAADTGIGERTLWRYVQVYDLNNDFQKLIAPYGKNVSISLLLGTSKKEDKKDECRHCSIHCK